MGDRAGYSPMQEPKYRFADGRVYNRASGEVIPLDEPVMVFRGRDKHAVRLITLYLGMVADIDHQDAVEGRLRQFEDFASAFPDRMKEPDTAAPDTPLVAGGGK